MSKNGIVKAIFRDAREVFAKRAEEKPACQSLAKRAFAARPELEKKIPVLNETLAQLAEQRRAVHPSKRSSTALNSPDLDSEFQLANRAFDKVVAQRTAIRDEMGRLDLIVEMLGNQPMWSSHIEKLDSVMGGK